MKRFILAMLSVGIFLFFLFPGFALADAYGLDDTAAAAGLKTSKSITTIIGDVVGTGLSLVSVLFFGLMLYAGIKWMLARGDEGKATEALDTIVAAIIGLIVVLASYAITNFVFKSVGTGGGGTEKSCVIKTSNGNEKMPATDTECAGHAKKYKCGTAAWCGTNQKGECVFAFKAHSESEKKCPSFKTEKACVDSQEVCVWE